MGNELEITQPEFMQVLRTSIYPGAADTSIKLAWAYCKSQGLDVMLKPVHIVPMYDRKSAEMRDVILPGIGLYRTTAARSGCAGISEPEFGPDIDILLDGQSFTVPKWCKVTAKRVLENGLIAEFSAIEFWVENYAMKGGKEKSVKPNAMWDKRRYGQIAKCAEAQALRKGFPEVGAIPTADEMEGKEFIECEVVRKQISEPERVTEPYPEEKLLTFLTTIKDSRTIDGLKDIYVKAVQAVNAVKDGAALSRLDAAKIERWGRFAAENKAAKETALAHSQKPSEKPLDD